MMNSWIILLLLCCCKGGNQNHSHNHNHHQCGCGNSCIQPRDYGYENKERGCREDDKKWSPYRKDSDCEYDQKDDCDCGCK